MASKASMFLLFFCLLTIFISTLEAAKNDKKAPPKHKPPKTPKPPKSGKPPKRGKPTAPPAGPAVPPPPVPFFKPVHPPRGNNKPTEISIPVGGKLNEIDSCWRGKANWESDRYLLASCVVGFGKPTEGGKSGEIYKVLDPGDDPVNPKPGTLRYAVIQDKPLWITFNGDMHIRLKHKLIIRDYKTIDGRGANVDIAFGPCIKIENAKHIIIHGIKVHDCTKGNAGRLRTSPDKVQHVGPSDGDSIEITSSTNIWIDHCAFAQGFDGLVDVNGGSTAITISNNRFYDHDKTMLLGNSDTRDEDEKMKVTVVYNKFDSGLVQRMPRVRFGYAHVANNWYNKWKKYAIGGSSHPTIYSDGNFFIAPDEPKSKNVTWRPDKTDWKNWHWRSQRDFFENGAFFVNSGGEAVHPPYEPSQRFHVHDGKLTPALTKDAGPLRCVVNQPC